MKSSETKKLNRASARLPEVRNYKSYSRTYGKELDLLDTDEDIVLQYYSTLNRRKERTQRRRERA